ncbi:uncharacterized protein B0H18DRAFT_972291 [Fomitopsis serialis]|uniref:uncharacterized protein n=1 Tax=Fomitopsis serialis TaxID=139415 RepID=UPI0020082988|nr:uncharacterized protein B0H18DRAFT_972291 [Neoantrodia serialis]KAH9936118.1 hypothetical protein B0H18DRAFT_972291 [Neoantrodia serialis]
MYAVLDGLCVLASHAASSAQQPLFYNFVDHTIKVLTGIQYGLSTLTDLLIIGSLFLYLQPSRFPGMKAVEGWYEYIAVFFINRGTCFTLLQLASFILFVTIPKQQVWILFHFVTSKTYINSLLLMLNFRNVHHGRGIDEEESVNQRDFKSSQPGTSSHSRTPGNATSRSVQFGVVDTESKAAAMTIGLDTMQSAVGIDDDDSDRRKPNVSDIDIHKSHHDF